MREHRGFEEDTAVQRRLASRDDGFEEKGEEGVKSEGMENIGGYRQKNEWQRALTCCSHDLWCYHALPRRI